jgi:hypothetical protein
MKKKPNSISFKTAESIYIWTFHIKLHFLDFLWKIGFRKQYLNDNELFTQTDSQRSCHTFKMICQIFSDILL